MRKYMVCLTLMLCLMLTACSGSEKDAPQGQVSLSEKKVEVEEKEVLLTVDGREVEAWQYLYWLRHACEKLAAEYAASGVEVDWMTETPEGTLADYVKAQALSDTALYATVENWAERYGCTIEEVTGTAEEGLTAVQAGRLEMVGRLYGELYTLFSAEGSALWPTDEKVDVFAREEGWVGVRQIRIPFGEDREAAKQEAAEMFSKLNASQDAETEFAALGGSGTQTLRLGDGQLPPEQEDALANLKEGEFSGILESKDGFVLLLRTKADGAVVRESLFDHLLLDAAATAEIRCAAAYKALDVSSFWQEISGGEEARM
jgi:hypothetical protein